MGNPFPRFNREAVRGRLLSSRRGEPRPVAGFSALFHPTEIPMTRSKPRALPVFVYLLVVVLPAAVAGCARSGTVAGKVSIDGRPVSGGMVSFLGADVEPGTQNSATGTIQPDGTYEANKVPVGPIKVCIMPDMRPGRRAPEEAPVRPLDREKGVRPKSKAAAPAATEAPGRIPPKYTKFETSGLTLTVHSGTNPFDIEMTSKNP